MVSRIIVVQKSNATTAYGQLLAKEQSLVLCFSRLFVIFSEARPHLSEVLRSFKDAGSCSYTVTVTTNCASPDYMRDHISFAFGDTYGNQIYAPKIDDPSSWAFERCSVDEFEIYGPCTYQVCYVYLYRIGYDDWMPETVTIYGDYTRAVTFYYNTFVPYAVWFGFNYCRSSTSSKSSSASAMSYLDRSPRR